MFLFLIGGKSTEKYSFYGGQLRIFFEYCQYMHTNFGIVDKRQNLLLYTYKTTGF